jgi:hypothetical protein
MDRYSFDVDLDRTFHFDAQIGIKTMPTHIRILPQVLQKLENCATFFPFIHSNASLQ